MENDDVAPARLTDGQWLLPEDFFNTTFERIQPLVTQRLAALEQKLGMRFPASYVQLLGVCNGGYIESRIHPSDTPRRQRLRASPVPVRGIAGVGNGSRVYDIEALTESMRGWGVNTDDFVAIDGEGHYWIAFDKHRLNARGEPTIAYVSSEEGPNGLIHSCTVADDFQSFLEALVLDDEG